MVSMLDDASTIHLVLVQGDNLVGFVTYWFHVDEVNVFAELKFIAVQTSKIHHGATLLNEFEWLAEKSRMAEVYLYS
jgi:hypothetical protein